MDQREKSDSSPRANDTLAANRQTHPLAELTVPLSNIHTDKYLRLAQFAVTVAQKSIQLHLQGINVIALNYAKLSVLNLCLHLVSSWFSW